ncbi:MAG: protein-methionine-sulfoxide reductase catalytic subunit MsrP [Deltaproteobacteria bacterium]|jgi:sulfoxide reductase catalytic subunit YedY|nr:protein-methionine-sulfoxide reductase catalytic subunit MsrP [Deltaproteobacteria bacterium]
MSIRRPAAIPSREITDEEVYLRRRHFLQAAAGAAVGMALTGCRAEEVSAGPAAPGPAALSGVVKGPAAFQTDEPSTPFEDVSTYNNFYEFGTDKEDPARRAGSLRTRPWSVAIEGEVARPGVVAIEDLLRPHALEERIYRLRCVEAWSMVIPWVGVPLGEVLKRFEPTSKARYVAFETLVDPELMPGQRRRILDWPYREALRIDEATHPLALLAVGMYGKVLPNQNGAPLRLVVPWKYGFKSIKSIVKVRLQEAMPETSWSAENPREYGFYANVNPEVSHPRWSQARERRIGDWKKRPTLYLNGYADQTAHLYKGMDPKKLY